MKKKSYGKYLLYVLSALSFLIAVWEGFLYYSDFGNTRFLQTILVLQNSIKAFLFSPDLGAKDVIDTLQQTSDPVEYMVGSAYALAVFIAPLCTASAAYRTVERLLRRGLRIPGKGTAVSVVYGWNKTVEELLSTPLSSSPVWLITDASLTEEQQLSLLRRNVTLCQSTNPKYLHKIWKRANRFFLLDDSSTQNFSTYVTLRRWWESESHPSSTVPRVICACSEPGIRELFTKFHDKDKNASSLPVSLLNFASLKAGSIWQDHPICSANFRPDSRIPDSGRYDVHMLITGLGNLGSEVLEQAISLGVLNSSGSLVFDVIDKRATDLMKRFLSRFSLDYIVTDWENAQFTIPSHHADGTLTVRFHSIDVDNSDLRSLLEELNQNPFTYAAICLKNPDSALRCAAQLSQVLQENVQSIPVALRMDFSDQVAEFFRNEKPFFGQFFPFGNKFTLDSIAAGSSYAGAVRFNYEYEKWSASLSSYPPEASTPEAAWNTKDHFQQDSSLFQYLHQSVKAARLTYERSHTSQYEVIPAHEMALLGQPPLSDGLAMEFARMEHRRWCYYMAVHGWGFGETKDKIQKKSPCMVPWAPLCAQEETSKTCPYDTTPYRILLQELAAPASEHH